MTGYLYKIGTAVIALALILTFGSGLGRSSAVQARDLGGLGGGQHPGGGGRAFGGGGRAFGGGGHAFSGGQRPQMGPGGQRWQGGGARGFIGGDMRGRNWNGGRSFNWGGHGDRDDHHHDGFHRPFFGFGFGFPYYYYPSYFWPYSYYDYGPNYYYQAYPYSYGGYAYGGTEQQGYYDGLDRGRDDAQNGRAYDPSSSSLYVNGSAAYRQGFLRGYQAAFSQD